MPTKDNITTILFVVDTRFHKLIINIKIGAITLATCFFLLIFSYPLLALDFVKYF